MSSFFSTPKLLPGSTNEVYHIQLDGLRCIAVLGPLVSHWMKDSFLDRFPFGFGVYLFFVISGFLITNILIGLKEEIDSGNSTFGQSYRKFIIRRTLRIFPIYYLIILVFYLLKSDEVRDNISWLLTYTLNVKIFIDNVWPSYISHIWTLAVEEQFYLLFPLVILTIPSKFFHLFFISIISCALISKQIFYFSMPDKIFSAVTFPLNSFDSICLGSLTAYYYRYNHQRLKDFLNQKLFWAFAFITIIVLTLYYYSFSNSFPVDNYFSRTLLTFCFSVLCIYLVGVAGTTGFKGIIGKILEQRTIVYIGKISYGIYLYHNFIPTLLNVFQIKSGFYFKDSPYITLIYLLVTVAVASLSWHLFEAPVNSYKKHFSYKNAEAKKENLFRT